MKNSVLVALCLWMTSVTFAQSLSGTVTDAKTNKGVPFASVYILGIELGTVTDEVREV